MSYAREPVLQPVPIDSLRPTQNRSKSVTCCLAVELRQQPLRFLLRQSASDHRLRHSPLCVASINKSLAQMNKSQGVG